MTTKQAAQGYNVNPLVGLTREETLSNCLEQVEYLQQSSEGMHQGYHVNLMLIRGALGHELVEASKNSEGEPLDK